MALRSTLTCRDLSLRQGDHEAPPGRRELPELLGRRGQRGALRQARQHLRRRVGEPRQGVALRGQQQLHLELLDLYHNIINPIYTYYILYTYYITLYYIYII